MVVMTSSRGATKDFFFLFFLSHPLVSCVDAGYKFMQILYTSIQLMLTFCILFVCNSSNLNCDVSYITIFSVGNVFLVFLTAE